jgi:hypothetical protein
MSAALSTDFPILRESEADPARQQSHHEVVQRHVFALGALDQLMVHLDWHFDSGYPVWNGSRFHS